MGVNGKGGGVGQLLMNSLNLNKCNVSSEIRVGAEWSTLRLRCSSQSHACLSPPAKLKLNGRTNQLQLGLHVQNIPRPHTLYSHGLMGREIDTEDFKQ